MAYASSECPDQPAYFRSLIRAFFARCQNEWIEKKNLSPDRNAGMYRVAWAFIFAHDERALFPS